MIDTVWIICDREITGDLDDWMWTPGRTRIRSGVKTSELLMAGSGEGPSWQGLTHPNGYLRVWGESIGYPKRFTKIEVELPRMLYPHNGYQLKSQDEVDRALAKLDELLGTFSKRMIPASYEYFNRIDLVGHFPFEAIERFLRIYRYHPVPGSHTFVYHYGDDGSAWYGSEQEFLVYNKAVQLEKKEKLRIRFQSLGRVELRYMKEKLKRIVGHGKRVSRLDFVQLEQVYWSYLDSMLKQRVQSKGQTIEDFLAVLQDKYPKDDIVGTYLDVCEIGKRHAPRIRSKVKKIQVFLSSFRWGDYRWISESWRQIQDDVLKLERQVDPNEPDIKPSAHRAGVTAALRPSGIADEGATNSSWL